MDPEIETASLSPPSQKEEGFTVIEMLVATAIMAILAVGAALALPRSGNPEQRDMVLFQKQFQSQQTLAITGRQSRGLKITQQGMLLALHQEEGWQISPREQRWQTLVNFAVHRSQTTNRPQHSGADTPEIHFLATGETTRFDITFGSTLRCQNNNGRALICSRP